MTTDLAIGDRVIPTGYGSSFGVPLWLANTTGTVVSISRVRVGVRFDSVTYGPDDRPHAVNPAILRRLS